MFEDYGSEGTSKKENSVINIDINIEDNNKHNRWHVSKKVNNIYYPNKEIIKNLKHKDYLWNHF